jgi:hypothetical protein
MKLPRVRFTVRRMMIAVGVCALLIVAPRYLDLGMGTATVEFVNTTNVPIEEVVIGSPGGEIRSKSVAPGATVQGKVAATSVLPNGWFKIDVRISVTQAGKNALVKDGSWKFTPTHESPRISYELVEDAAGKSSLKRKTWFAGGQTPEHKLYLWEKLTWLRQWH